MHPVPLHHLLALFVTKILSCLVDLFGGGGGGKATCNFKGFKKPDHQYITLDISQSSILFYAFVSIIEKGELECQSLIEAHKQCMRQHGFNI